MLRHLGRQVEARLRQQSSLKMHKRAIERQLAALAARIAEPDAVLLPRSVFLLLELRGSGGVSAQLEQIARIVHEQGYWKPHGPVPTYQRADSWLLRRLHRRCSKSWQPLLIWCQFSTRWMRLSTCLRKRSRLVGSAGSCDTQQKAEPGVASLRCRSGWYLRKKERKMTQKIRILAQETISEGGKI